MQLHQIQPAHQPSVKKRVGRGGKKGTYSGKGMKGQKSRSGARIRPAWRDLLKKIPKKRGYKFKPVTSKPAVVNLADIEKKFKSGETVSPAALIKKGLIRRVSGKIPPVKILGTGKLSKKIKLEGFSVSGSVKSAVADLGKVVPNKEVNSARNNSQKTFSKNSAKK